MQNKILDKIKVVIINLLNNSIISLQLILNPIKFMRTEDLLTVNRLDLNLRVEFLQQVVNGKKADKTRYYKFMQAFDYLNPDILSNRFLDLYNNIKKNGFKKYLVVVEARKYNKMEEVHKSYRQVSGKKIKSKYQLFGGAHRFAVCRFLGYKKIPVKIVSSPFLDFPDFTSFIKRNKI